MVPPYYPINLLHQPFNATRINAACIEDRVKELQKENKNVTGKAGFYEEFEVRFAKIDLAIITTCQNHHDYA